MNDLYKVRIQGRDIKRFIKTLHSMKVQFYYLEEQKHSCMIEVNREDYEKLMQMKTIYEIELIDTKGLPKLKELFQKYKIFLGSLLIGGCLLYFLTHLTLEIEVVHNKKEIRNLIIEELENAGISKFRFIKSFAEQEKITADILKKHRDTIEWMEIERVGTKYVVKVEERKLNEKEETATPRNLVAKKDGLIISIEAKKGEVIGKKNTYVKKGDILISGVIKNNEEIVGNIAANGKVFAETWYHINVELPTFYREEQKTGSKKKVLSFVFLGKRYSLFDFSPYQYKKETELYRIGNPLIPFGFTYTEQEEIDHYEELYTKDQAILKATQIAGEKLKKKLGKEDKIIDQKSLKINEEDSKIIVDLFFRVKEDITDYQDIPKEVSPDEKQTQE